VSIVAAKEPPMDCPIAINDHTYWVGVNDRETDLFEALWPIPRGVSYNAYVVVDDKVAVVDTVKKVAFEAYLDKIKRVLGQGKGVDYLIVNHLEPDHSGSIGLLREVFPAAQIVCTKKAVEFLAHLNGITENVKAIEDGEELDLGKHKLKFFITPMVHWPETMVTYGLTDKTLFSCDAFGGFGALDGGIFDDELDIEDFDDEILRYFSNIVGKYCTMVQRALAKLKGLEVKVIAPSHGPIWRKNPARIISDYDRWSRHEAERGVVIAYGSMYANTTRMMEAVASGLIQEKCPKVRVHDVSRTHVSYIIRDAWRYQALVLGGPTYDTKLFPPMQHLVRLLDDKMLKNRIVGVFGTYGWSGGGVKTLAEFAKKGDFELVEPVVEARFSPSAEDTEQCRLLGRNIAQRIRSPAAQASPAR